MNLELELAAGMGWSHVNQTMVSISDRSLLSLQILWISPHIYSFVKSRLPGGRIIHLGQPHQGWTLSDLDLHHNVPLTQGKLLLFMSMKRGMQFKIMIKDRDWRRGQGGTFNE